jgi:hypothetical protein
MTKGEQKVTHRHGSGASHRHGRPDGPIIGRFLLEAEVERFRGMLDYRNWSQERLAQEMVEVRGGRLNTDLFEKKVKSAKRQIQYLLGQERKFGKTIAHDLAKAFRMKLGDLCKKLAGGTVVGTSPRFLAEKLAPYAPIPFIRRLRAPEQKQAATEAYLKHIETLGQIEAGKLPLSISTADYFDHFLTLARSGSGKAKARVFARLLHLEVREKLGETGPLEHLKKLKEAVTSGGLEIEYVILLRARASLQGEATRQILRAYSEFASGLHVHFENATDLTTEETSRTIALIDKQRFAFTHDWDYHGHIEKIVKFFYPEDYERLSGLYEKIKRRSELFSSKMIEGESLAAVADGGIIAPPP